MRSATLVLPSGRTINRPISKLCPIECPEKSLHQQQKQLQRTAQETKRPRRNAAAIAAVKNEDLIDDGKA